MPFTPSSISGLTCWYKSDAGVLKPGGSPATNNGDAVDTWQDQSGNGNHLTQSTSANRPTFQLAQSNGQPAIRFDGSNDGMTAADSSSYKTSIVDVFIAGKLNQVAAGQAILGYPHNTTHTSPFFRWVVYIGVSTVDIDLRIDTDDISSSTSGSPQRPVASAAWDLYSYDTNARDFYRRNLLFFNGSGRTVTYPNAVGLYVGMNAGGGENANMDVGEILIYNSELSAANRLLVYDYLYGRFLSTPTAAGGTRAWGSVL